MIGTHGIKRINAKTEPGNSAARLVNEKKQCGGNIVMMNDKYPS
jgi:hypothetical protein